MEWLDLCRLIVALAVMVMASYSDWKTRLASDLYWLFMGCVGLGLIAYEVIITGADSLYLLFLVPMGVVFFDIFWDRRGLFEEGLNLVPLMFYIAAVISLAYLLINFWGELLFWHLLDVLIMFFLIMFLYQIDVIKGGADAKSLIALSLMFPVYPAIAGFPLLPVPNDLFMIIFPFSLLVLFNAALLSLVVPIGLFFYNLIKRDVKIPAMLLGYKIGMREAKKKFVWPMERVEDGELKFVYFPKEDEENERIIQELSAYGVKRLWVTPKIPFLIFITAGVAMSALVGNVVLALMG